MGYSLPCLSHFKSDIYAEAMQGRTAEAAVRWPEGKLKKIYET
jgi:hypothetical protein